MSNAECERHRMINAKCYTCRKVDNLMPECKISPMNKCSTYHNTGHYPAACSKRPSARPAQPQQPSQPESADSTPYTVEYPASEAADAPSASTISCFLPCVHPDWLGQGWHLSTEADKAGLPQRYLPIDSSSDSLPLRLLFPCK